MLKFGIIGGVVGLAIFFISQATMAQTEIIFWTTEIENKSLQIQQNLASKFHKENPGIKVKIIPVDSSTLLEKVTFNKLPDIIFHPIDYTARLAGEKIFDVDTATEIIKDLDENTLSTGALNLVRYQGGFAAIPVDGWGQILIYRKDLLEDKGYSAPQSWENIKKAAQVLNDSPLIWGFEVPTSPEDSYTQQVFEGFSLSNNARLVNAETGMVNLNTPEFIDTLRFYKALSKFTPPGNVQQYHTKMDYLRGRCAMMMWPSFILSQICGLEGDERPLVKDLHKKTGFVAVIKGEQGAAQYGQVNYLGITKKATKDAVKKWVKFILEDEYLTWLSMRPEGKLPLRKGTSEEPGKFMEGWKELMLGSKVKSKISNWYDNEVLNSILIGTEKFDRWGFANQRGLLMTRIYHTNLIPIVLKRYLGGDIFTAEVTAELMNDLVEGLENENLK